MSPLNFSHSRFTLRNAVYALFTVFLLGGVIAYMGFQARFLIAGPQISIAAPEDSVSGERVIVLEGDAANIARMSLNGRPIYTNADGHFSEKLVLENGYTTATIRAEDRYGRTISVERGFVFTPPAADAMAHHKSTSVFMVAGTP